MSEGVSVDRTDQHPDGPATRKLAKLTVSRLAETGQTGVAKIAPSWSPSDAPAASVGSRLKHHPKAELQLPVLVDLNRLISVRRSNLAESCIAVIGIRPVEMRSVRRIERLGPEFQIP